MSIHNVSRFGIVLACAILPSLSLAQSMELGADTSGARAVKDFISAIKEGDATKMRGLMAPPLGDREIKAQFDWVKNVALLGPKLPDTLFTPITNSRIKGDIGVVIGGYGPPKPYTRVLRRQGKWKLMIGPEDARTVFGLTATEAQTLKELDTWAATQRPASPAPVTGKPPLPVSPPVPAAPTPSAMPADPLPPGVPTTAPTHTWLSSAAKLLVDEIAKSDKSEQVLLRRSIPILLRAGYVNEATRLLESFPEPFDIIQTSGQVTAYLPGGASSAEGRAFLRASRDLTLTFWVGYAEGSAYRGDAAGIQTALTAMKDDVLVLEAALNLAPSEALLSKTESVSADSLSNVIRAFGKGAVTLGSPERAIALLEKLRKAPPPSHLKPAQWADVLSTAEDNCHSGMAIGWAMRGEFQKARTNPGKYNKENVESEIATYQARLGDLEGFKKTIAAMKNTSAIEPLAVYIYAFKGDMASAERELQKSRLVADKIAWGYGLAAHAKLKAGDVTGAGTLINQGLAAIDGAKLGSKPDALLRLIRGGLVGPESNPNGI